MFESVCIPSSLLSNIAVPNDGVIWYRGAFNGERVLVTSPKALAEVLVTNSYDFIKPKQLSETIGRILGIGILFAEGDEHKVRVSAIHELMNKLLTAQSLATTQGSQSRLRLPPHQTTLPNNLDEVRGNGPYNPHRHYDSARALSRKP